LFELLRAVLYIARHLSFLGLGDSVSGAAGDSEIEKRKSSGADHCLACGIQQISSSFLRKMIGTRYGPIVTRFSLILGTRIGSVKHLKKN